MASDQGFVTFVCDQMAGAGSVTVRKRFGEYAVYCDGKVVGLVCDNQLFVKPTAAGKSTCDQVVEAPPYRGAKPHLLITDRLDDTVWLSRLIRLTLKELPAPKPKKSRSKATVSQ
jgi:TfoX/Sxy family transcriptional regulator of competence genes